LSKESCEARHRFKGATKKWRNVTPGFILVFFGIICILSATKIRNADFLYSSSYHTSNPMVQNACTQDSFLQIRRYIHFVNNASLLPKDNPKWHHLQKIQIIINKILTTLAAGWILRKQICVDESMIKYMGRFVSFIQYMPAKPIKHGIKVYALCCAYTGYLYGFEIYTGKGNTPDGSPKGVISRLLYAAGATGASGRILYTDNFYTSLAVMKYLFNAFSMLLVGTYALTKKKSRTADDFPFAKLSNGALKKVKRGWTRIARRKVVKENRTTPLYTVQATVWKDKKLVGFLHNHLVDDTEDHTVERWSPTKKRRKAIPSHAVVTDYSYHRNGVDHKDRDTADWTVSLKSNRFYLRIFYWLFDGVLHAMYTIIKVVASDKAHPWHKYLSKHLGRYKFQMDLANDLISRGISMDWLDVEDINMRPVYVRSQDYVPCGCMNCFFCKKGLTHGIEHKKKGKRRRRSVRPECPTERSKVTENNRRCTLCYKNQRALDPEAPHGIIDRPCKKTRLGFTACDSNVCAGCWNDFEHSLV
jgi:hypothetical protein